MKRHYSLIFKLVTTLVFGCSYGATAATTKPAIGTTSTSKVTVTNDFLVTNHGVVNDSSLLQLLRSPHQRLQGGQFQHHRSWPD